MEEFLGLLPNPRYVVCCVLHKRASTNLIIKSALYLSKGEPKEEAEAHAVAQCKKQFPDFTLGDVNIILIP